MGKNIVGENAQRRVVSRRRFVGEVALGAAGAAAITTHTGCGDASGQVAESRAFLRPDRFEWKRREVHPRSDRGWADTNYTSTDPGVPQSLSIFGADVGADDFAAALSDVAVTMDVVYAFWDGSFAQQTETTAPLGALLDRLRIDLPSGDSPFVVASSRSRESIFASAPERVAAELTDPDYRYRLTFPRAAAVDSGAIVFHLDTDLSYYAFAVEGYGARAFVKYFQGLEAADTYQGPDDTALDDYVVANIPVDDFLDLDTDARVAELPSWS